VRPLCTEFIEESISATTRPPRDGEVDGREYHFFSKEVFMEKIHKKEFLEYAVVHRNYYGSPKSELERIEKL
jgi:guanylate kinase